MKTVYADSQSQHVKSMIVFANSDGKLYSDEEFTELASGDELSFAIRQKLVLVNYEGEMHTPSSFVDGDGEVEVSIIIDNEGTLQTKSFESGPKVPSVEIVLTPDSIDYFGKVASELCSDWKITDDYRILATLNYVTGYTGFSGLEEEQEGWYLPTHYIPTPSEAEVHVYKTFGTVGWKQLGKPDLALCSRITDKYKNKLIVYAEYNGLKSDPIELDLSGLKLLKP